MLNCFKCNCTIPLPLFYSPFPNSGSRTAFAWPLPAAVAVAVCDQPESRQPRWSICLCQLPLDEKKKSQGGGPAWAQLVKSFKNSLISTSYTQQDHTSTYCRLSVNTDFFFFEIRIATKNKIEKIIISTAGTFLTVKISLEC